MSEIAPSFTDIPAEPDHERTEQRVRPFGADVLHAYANALDTAPLVAGTKKPTYIQTIANGRKCGTDYVTPDE